MRRTPKKANHASSAWRVPWPRQCLGCGCKFWFEASWVGRWRRDLFPAFKDDLIRWHRGYVCASCAPTADEASSWFGVRRIPRPSGPPPSSPPTGYNPAPVERAERPRPTPAPPGHVYNPPPVDRAERPAPPPMSPTESLRQSGLPAPEKPVRVPEIHPAADGLDQLISYITQETSCP